MVRNGGRVTIPPRAIVASPGSDDPIDYYYRPLTAPLYRARLQLAADLLGPGVFERTLEIGYGSGIFLPELARRSRRLAGVEIHDAAPAVSEMLTELGLEAELHRGSVLDLPFARAEFDAVVCLSVLEHLRELDAAVAEIQRVLRPGGVAVLGFPVRNPITDGFFCLVGYNPRAIHPSSHSDILSAVRRNDGLVLERVARFPSFLPLPLSAYVACRARVR